jgi:transposase
LDVTITRKPRHRGQGYGVCAVRAEGLRVTDVQAGPGGTLEVSAVTDYPAAAACPACGMISSRVHETVLARPRDVRRAADPVDLRWVKVRRKCGNPGCPRKTFTEWASAVPPRCRITTRLREQAGAEVTERGITPAEAARHAGISWPVAHHAFAAAARPLLEQHAAPVTHLGIDEHRRGRARFAVNEQTGQYTLLADRWQCAMRRLVVFPAQPGGTRREVLGSDGLPGSER